MTTSVAVLPASPLLTHESYAQTSPARPRPKLSLNTSISTSMRKGSTGLSIASLATVSLTDRNTFVNAWDPVTVPATPFTQILPSFPANETSAPQTHSIVQSPDSIRPSSSDSSPRTPIARYALSKLPRSILTNSLHPQREQHARAKRMASTAPKLMFPPTKRVCFSQHLAEEITTVRFTFTHQDLLIALQTPKSYAGVKRESPPPEEIEQSTDEESNDMENDEDADEQTRYAKTPVAGRKRRKGEWRWTLGPIDDENDGVADGIVGTERRGSDSSESSTSSGSSSDAQAQGWSKSLMNKIRVDEWRIAS